MTRQPIESRMLAEVGYDAATQTLEVQFRPNKSTGIAPVWRYSPVPHGVYLDMIDPAQSAGRIFGERVKNNPDRIAEKVEPEAVTP